MTQTNATQATEMAPDKTAIRRFEVGFPDEEHFAAFEQPEYLTTDLREAFKTLR